MLKEHEVIAKKITSFFEVGNRNPYKVVSPNFDGQGVSWGPHQHNLGQGTLQPVLREIKEKFPTVWYGCLPCLKDECVIDYVLECSKSKAVEYVQENWHNGCKLKPEWITFFECLGESAEARSILDKHSAWISKKAFELSNWMSSGNNTIRSYALAYDIVTQNGGIGKGLRLALTAARPFLNVYKSILLRRRKYDDTIWYQVVAISRAAQSRVLGQKKYFLDVLSRKLLIVDGAAEFRGSWVDLEKKFGLSNKPIGDKK